MKTNNVSLNFTVPFLFLFLCAFLLRCTSDNTPKSSSNRKVEPVLDTLFSKNLSFVNDSAANNSEMFRRFNFIYSCYESERISKLVTSKASEQEDSKGFYFVEQVEKLTETEFNTFTHLEHFIFAFNHPESYRQSCSFLRIPNDISRIIPGQLIRKGEGICMSSRQGTALSSDRDSTILLLRDCILKDLNVGEVYKRTIVKLKAFELIPSLIEIYKSQETKDPYILSTICLLMKNESETFRESSIYRALYKVDAIGFNSDYYKDKVPFTHRNSSYIINQARTFYETKSLEESEYIKVPGNIFQLGSLGHEINPPREERLMSFEISKYEITNAQFEIFINETGYVTTAEEKKDALVFRIGLPEFEWEEDTTAYWRFPNGVSQGGIEDKMNHPVTCISYNDAQRYCWWANVSLPTIEQWEVASRAGSSTKYFFNDSESIYQYANVWHGKNHLNNAQDEDFLTTSPVGSFAPNPLGIFDIYGNVFEFCYNSPEAFGEDWQVAATRGGSWWCSEASCSSFNSEDIGRVQRSATFSNNGFRVVR